MTDSTFSEEIAARQRFCPVCGTFLSGMNEQSLRPCPFSCEVAE